MADDLAQLHKQLNKSKAKKPGDLLDSDSVSNYDL